MPPAEEPAPAEETPPVEEAPPVEDDGGFWRDGDLVIEVTGWLPEDVTAEAGYIEFDEKEAFSEVALAAVDLNLYDAEGAPYIPEAELTVAIDGRLVNSAVKNDMPLLVYACEENLRREESRGVYAADVLVYRDIFGADERLAYEEFDEYRHFENDEDAVRCIEADGGLNVYTDNTIDFTLVYDAEAEMLPLRFVLSAQLTKRTLEAEAGGTAVTVYGALSENVSAEVEAVDYDAPVPDAETVLAVDITLTHEDAEDFAPDQPISVSITDASIAEAAEAGGELTLWDIAAEAPVEDAAVEGDALSFSTDGFSVYVVVQGEPTVEYRFIDAGGEEYLDLRQTLRSGDILSQPMSPADDGKLFDFWTEVTVPAESTGGKTAFTGWGAVTVPDLPEGEKYPIPVYLKAVFESAEPQVRAVFHDQEGKIYRTEVVPSGESIDPSLVGYSAKQINSGEYLVFQYWTADLYELTGGSPAEFTAQPLTEDVDL